jgi:hypothetical protein
MIRNLNKLDIPQLMEFFYFDRNLNYQHQSNYQEKDIEDMLQYSQIIQYVWEDNKQVVAYLCGYDLGISGFLDVLIVKKSHRNRFISIELVKKFILDHPNWKMIETSFFQHDKDSEKYIKIFKFGFKKNIVWVGKKL